LRSTIGAREIEQGAGETGKAALKLECLHSRT
jgi:hypothetical protein